MTKRRKRKNEGRKRKRGCHDCRHAALEGRARVARESCDPKFTFVCDRGAPISI